MKNRVLLCLVAALLLTTQASARNYYVSAAGNNNNNGLTQVTAWQTISKVNSYFASMAAGDSILFRCGDTFFGTLVVGKSGTSTAPITISAYGTGAKPVISGFINVSSWSLVSGGVYQALVTGAKSTLNVVTVNNIPQALGRYPNDNASNGGYLNYETFTANTITDNEMDAGTNWTGAEVVIRKKLWVLDRCKITAHTGSVFTFTNIGSTYEGTNGFGYFIQNDPRTLDKFGEWYFNNTTKNLQVFFGTDAPSSYTVKASGLDTLISIVSKNYITIDNLVFEGANVNTFLASSSSYISIKNCDFTNAGTGAINATAVSNLLIDNCTTNNILSNAIIVNNTKTSNVTIRNCSVKNTGAIPGMGLSNGNSYKGIVATASSNLLIEYNRVDTTGYVGIEFQGSNVTVKNNVVNYFDFIKDDAGGIYTYSSGSDASPGTIYTNRVVRENIVMNGAGAPNGRSSSSLFVTGIYLDGRTMNVDVLNNTVFNNGKNGIHCNNPQNINIKGNTSYNNLNAVSTMRWAHLGEIRGLSVKNNIFYPKTDAQRTFYYCNSGLNEPTTTTVNAALTALGSIDSNYYGAMNAAGFLQEIYTTTGGALIATSPLSLEGWRANSLHDTTSKKTSKSPVAYKVSSFVGTNKFTNGLFTSTISGLTVFGSGTTGSWDNTGKISGGSLRVTFTSPGANKYSLVHSAIGAVSAGKQYLLRFSTYGTTQQGVIRAYIRKTASPYTNLTPIQTKSYGTGRKDHEFLFAAPTTDAGGSFVIEIEQNSGTTYFDNVEFYEVTAQLYDVNSQLRFEYNDTKLARTVALGTGRYTAVDGTVYTTSITLQPFTSVILVKDTGLVALAATASATTIKCFGDSATVTVAATGGTQPYTGTGTFKVRAGTYTYTVTDATGVTSSATLTISQPASALTVSATVGIISIAGGTTTATVSASGGTPPYTGTGSFTIAAGTYTYTISDANGCTATITRTVADGVGPFTLTAIANPTAGGTVTGAGVYTAGAAAALTATPATGYTFTGWSGDITGTTAAASVTMDANKSVTANFAPITYSLTATVSPAAGGTVTGTGTYASGATASLTATPAAGYIFSGWSGAATGTTNPVSVSMTSNKTVTATFTPITYTLTATASPTAGGTVAGAGTYAYGTTATLTATPATGYVFSGWSGAATGTAATITVTMDANKSVTATFTAAAVTYTLTATASPTAGGAIAGTGTYASGATASLTATPAAGYTFSGWSGAATGSTNPVTVSMTANKTITATFAPITYTLTATVTPTSGGTVTGTGSYASGATATLTATPAAGYTFSGWSGAATGTTATVTVSMTANKTVAATFAPITYTLTATVSPTAGGTVTGTGTYASGATATLTATPAAGYTFSGWTGAATGTTATVTVLMTANKTVTATFTPITYSLTATASPTAGGTVGGAGTYAFGATATLTANPATGYVFSGWSGAASGTAATVTVTMDANKSVTATFTAIATNYTLTTTASPTAGGAISGGGTYASGATATVTATPAAGYTFSGWSGAVTGTTNPVTVSMTANRSVTATFTQITYTLAATANPTAGGTITGTGTYNSGATATLTATPATGYVFSSWSGAVTGTTNPVTVSMTANRSVTATFTQITYTLAATANPTAGGTITGAGTYNSGATATLTATPATGYVFSGWSGAVTGTTNPVTVTMTSNKSVTATFTPITYTLTATASPTAGGTVTGAGTYAYGATATLTAAPATGYVFSGWSGAVTGTAATITVTMDANKTVTATFTAAPVTYTLTVTASPTAGGTVTGTGTYASGATATLTATPAAGYAFSGWSGAATGTTNPVTVSMTSNKSVTATFTRITYVMTTAVVPSAGGRITGAGTYNAGATATITAIPSAGYVFSGWSGAATGTTNPVSVTMNSNNSIVGTFTPITYTLTATANPTVGGTITGAGTYSYNATATLRASTMAGYTFAGWSGDTTSTDSTITIVMLANKNVTANFNIVAANTTLRIEDDTIGTRGLCSIEGTVSNNSGATNRRSINLTNSASKGLNWSVNAGATGAYSLKWRYANGSTSNTYFMRLIVNGIVINDSVPFPKTTGSSSFVNTGDHNITLQSGNNSIRLESIENRATADVDWMEVTGYAPAIGDCSQTGARPAATATEATAITSRTTGVYPNPAYGQINVGFTMTESQKITVVILDAAGNPVGQSRPQLYPAGYNTQSYNMAGKAAGIYTAIVTGDKNFRIAYKFVVVQ